MCAVAIALLCILDYQPGIFFQLSDFFPRVHIENLCPTPCPGDVPQVPGF